MATTRRRVLAAGALAPLAASRSLDHRVSARQATPPAGTPAAGGGTTEVVARGLVNPRGFTWLPDGRMVVAEAGSGGPTARVVAVEPDGTLTELLGGFPTARVVFRGISGIADVAIGPDGQLYALVSGGDINRDLARNGLYRLDGAGGAEFVADISAFIRDNPVANVPGDYDDDGQPYRLLPTAEDDGYVVTEGNSCQLLRVGLDGTVARVADLSADNWIPTGLAEADEGEVYAATFTGAPFAAGSARVLRVAGDGSLETAWSNLTMVTDLALGPDGNCYALEMASGYSQDTGGPVPESGRVVRLRSDRPDAPEVLVEGLHYPAHLRIGPEWADGGAPVIYVSGPTLEADDASGTVIRVTLPSA